MDSKKNVIQLRSKIFLGFFVILSFIFMHFSDICLLNSQSQFFGYFTICSDLTPPWKSLSASSSSYNTYNHVLSFFNRSLFEGQKPGINDFIILPIALSLIGYISLVFKKSKSEVRHFFGFVTYFSILNGIFGTHLIKFVWARPRPYLIQQNNIPFSAWNVPGNLWPFGTLKGSGSFPSGHTSLLVSGMIILFIFIKCFYAKKNKNTPKSIRLMFLCGALPAIAFMMHSRVSTGQHWPSDCIGAALISLFIGYSFSKKWFSSEGIEEQPFAAEKKIFGRFFLQCFVITTLVVLTRLAF